jgi:hypothetical protein
MHITVIELAGAMRGKRNAPLYSEHRLLLHSSDH